MVTSSKHSLRGPESYTQTHSQASTHTDILTHTHTHTHRVKEGKFVSYFSCFREVNCVTVGGDTFPAGDFSSGHDKLHSSHFTCLSPTSPHTIVVYASNVYVYMSGSSESCYLSSSSFLNFFQSASCMIFTFRFSKYCI